MHDDYSVHLSNKFFSDFQSDCIGDLLRLIAEQCKNAVLECSVYQKEFAKNLAPYVRRTKIEDKITDFATDYEGVKATVQKTKRGHVFYSELVSNRTILTVHKVATTKTVVRKAVHRETLARHSQIHMFDEQKPIPLNAILYGQLKYGIAHRFPQALAFALIDFPDEKGEIARSLNLLAMPIFKEIPMEFFDVRTDVIDDIERIGDDLIMGLRSDARNKDKKTATGDSDGQASNHPSTDPTAGNRELGDE